MCGAEMASNILILLEKPRSIRLGTQLEMRFGEGRRRRIVARQADVRDMAALDALDPYEIIDNVQRGAPTEVAVGGRTVMAGQLRKLEQTAQLPQIRLQVLPFAAGGHIGLTNSFVIFSFPAIGELDVVVVDHLTSTLYVDRKEDIAAYAAAFARLRARALPEQESAAMIAGIRTEMSSDDRA